MQRLSVLSWFLFALGSLPSVLQAQSFVVEPYLQRATPTSIEIHWETDGRGDSRVEWGETRQLGQVASVRSRRSGHASKLHAAALSGLASGTRYYYRVHTGSLHSEIIDLRTPPAAEAEAELRLVVLSDMQLDVDHPHVYRDLVRDGIMPLVGEQARASGRAPALVLIPGDLVRHGDRYDEWSEEFFAPIRPLAKHVPLLPVAGNHDEDSPHYFRYFALPSDGLPAAPERWWSSDFSNVRVVGLDTNGRYRNADQLAWLERVLHAACEAKHVDFVFAALHHPELSELWPNGELAYSGLISRTLEQFSTRCGKPSVVFSGHTHAYGRGHSRDAPLTLVDVASAGGNLDYAGEHEAHQYPEYVTSQADYGFVVVDVKAGDDPSFRIRRISRGTPQRPLDNVLRDEVTVRRDNHRPAQPEALWPRDEQVNPREVVLTSSHFRDVDGDTHGATHWQVTGQGCDFGESSIDVWRQHGSKVAADPSATSTVLPNALRLRDLPGQTSFCYRVRVRDGSLTWSEWSTPAHFQTLALPSEQVAEQLPARTF